MSIKLKIKMEDKRRYDFIFKDGSNIFFTSDTHAYHEFIIQPCGRPFKNAEEMNETMIKNWNAVTNDDSIIFCLGDMVWGGYNKWKEFFGQLKGHKILIKGNHDMRNLTSTAEKEFFDFSTFQMQIKIEDRAVYLNHYPFLCYGGTYRNDDDKVWQLYGHVHYGPYSMKGLDVPRMEYIMPTQYDVGVDMNNFTPISWNEVKEKITHQVENNVNLTHWIKK